MDIIFKKMHGTLNDFVVFHDLENRVALTEEQVSFLCDRRAGIGADGVIAVRHSNNADFFMDYINADGSLAEMCGNGIRCLAKYVHDAGLTHKKIVSVETRAGVKILELVPGNNGKIGRVKVDMGPPIFEPEKIPVKIRDDHPIIDFPIESQGQLFLGTLVSMGNPHCVIFLNEKPDAFPLKYGPTIERHELFPAKTNVEFVQVPDRKNIVMRVWERGSGETLACGTGACAAVVAGIRRGLLDSPVRVATRGGALTVAWSNGAAPVMMTGPAETVFEGEWSVPDR